MFSNNFKIAWRTLQKNKLYTFINLFGLTVGIAAALLIFRMVYFELSFNKDFQDYDQIIRVVAIDNEENELSICTPIPAMEEMQSTVPQFKEFSRIREDWSYLTVSDANSAIPKKKFAMQDEETGFFVEPDFAKIFDFEWLAGEKEAAFKEPGTIVLTKSTAEKCFENWENALGKTIRLNDEVPVKVIGVLADLPLNCDFNFPFLISYETVRKNANAFWYEERWGSCSSNDQVFAKLEKNADQAEINELLATVGKERYTDKDTGIQQRMHVIQPLSDIHYNQETGSLGSHTISATRLKMLGFIGILILIMACFNFINLATAQATLRAKEVGVRKTLGSSRKELMGQFMSETGIIVLIAVVLGANLAVICSPYLKYISDVPDNLPFLSQPIIWGFLVLIAIVLTLLAGLYPSLKLSGFQPVKALNNNITTEKSGGVAVRKSLVVLQFAVAQALIIGTLITILQIDYIQSKDLGFKQDLVYEFGFDADTTALHTALKEKLLALPSIEEVSLSSDSPLSGNTWATNWRYSSRPKDEEKSIAMKFVDANFHKTFGIELLAGRWFHPSDTIKEAVINKNTLDYLQIANPEEVLGEKIAMGREQATIVGVTTDFHTHDLKTPLQPTIMTTSSSYYWMAAVKIRPKNLQSTVGNMNRVFDEVFPNQVFDGNFYDEDIASFYENDTRLANTCKGFGLLAILISCLGLFGLATHSATQRIKEIGIRKVLGASVSSIITLLSKDFLKLVITALIIAVPVAYYFMNDWLNDFNYRIELQWWVFVLAGVMAVVIAFLSVSYQSIRAAVASPIHSLKDE